jgi:hypothetical protein
MKLTGCHREHPAVIKGMAQRGSVRPIAPANRRGRRAHYFAAAFVSAS